MKSVQENIFEHVSLSSPNGFTAAPPHNLSHINASNLHGYVPCSSPTRSPTRRRHASPSPTFSIPSSLLGKLNRGNSPNDSISHSRSNSNNHSRSNSNTHTPIQSARSPSRNFLVPPSPLLASNRSRSNSRSHSRNTSNQSTPVLLARSPPRSPFLAPLPISLVHLSANLSDPTHPLSVAPPSGLWTLEPPSPLRWNDLPVFKWNFCFT
jgi:hypothetical protein